MNVRTRFAPSPTGFTHVGGARTALYGWLFARKHGGKFILRIEDTDKEREVEGAIDHLMESLKWLGMTWDESIDVGGPYEPYLQSARLELYRAYAQKLIDAGHAYVDPYTSEEVDAFRKTAEENKKAFLYRDHRPEIFAKDFEDWYGKKPLRFRVPIIKRYEWHDLVFGDLSAGEEALDDFILIKSDGYPTYNFCHVIDDIEMKITHVTRGQEFISSTPKFLSLYDALGAEWPQFASFPAILGESGQKKLGKRDGAKDILDYRAEGYLPGAMVNFLSLLGWNPGTEQEIFSMEELIAAFDFDRMQRSGAMFNEEKLLFMNQQWMRKLSDEEFIRRGELEAPNKTVLLKAVPLLKERANTFLEARKMLSGELLCLFVAPASGLDKEKLEEKSIKNEDSIKIILNSAGNANFTKETSNFTHQALAQLVPAIEALPEEASADAVKEALMPFADANPKELGGRGAILWPLRYALSGLDRSPDPFTLIHILGKEESVLRIQTALAILGE
jgi:glutamyl-tRNA synthetase